MVRLKGRISAHSKRFIYSFNSTMVRLKAATEIANATITGFQFHYGSIKGSYEAVSAVMLESFNSTMVRLKALASHAAVAMKQVSIPLWFD